MGNNFKVGLALGGGVARGLAHIGVLKILLRAGVKIDYLAGTSIGSLIASLYACGLSLKVIEELARGISRRVWMDYTLPRMGLMAGERLEQLVSLLTRRRRIEELPLPLGIIATDLTEGKRVILRAVLLPRRCGPPVPFPGYSNRSKLMGG